MEYGNGEFSNRQPSVVGQEDTNTARKVWSMYVFSRSVLIVDV